jgi:hypothetical protein
MSTPEDSPTIEQSKLDATAAKYAESFDKFSKSKSGNVVLDFIAFKRNLIPHTLTILYVLGVLAIVLNGLGVIVKAGPLADMVGDNFIERLIAGLIVIVAGPFVIHYILEIVKYLWPNVIVPIWNKVVIRFFVNVLPEVLPFLLERFMKWIDILLDGLVTIIMTVAAVLKGVIWLPKTLCQRLGRWAKKPLEGEAPAK